MTAGGAALAGGLLYRQLKDAAADWYRKLVELDRSSPGGELAPKELAALEASARALLGEGIDENRYRDFFIWKAANAGGYLALYKRFVQAIDEEARSYGGQEFTAAGVFIQKRALSKATEVRRLINEDDKAAGLRFALLDRDWLTFERYIVRELLTLFARTDAWLISGYGPHPGVPRGLEAYRRAPGSEPL